jgi:4-diphosphocytidyl-2-C-methyl-D-erythritol kinase
VPFFIFGQNAWVGGVGEQLQVLPLDPAYYVVLTPPLHVSTAQVFASFELTRNTIPTTIAAFSERPLSGSGESFKNDLEPVVCRQYSAIAHRLEWLGQFSRARMSGSGASVFAEFENQTQAKLVFDKISGEKKLQQTASFMARGLNQHPHYSFAD